MKRLLLSCLMLSGCGFQPGQRAVLISPSSTPIVLKDSRTEFDDQLKPRWIDEKVDAGTEVTILEKTQSGTYRVRVREGAKKDLTGTVGQGSLAPLR